MDKIFVFVFGAVIGSFLNVCIHRLPKRQSVAVPPSHCPACKKDILWYDNIPVLSYIILGGRCRFCKVRISPRYLLVELLTAAIFLALYTAFGPGIKFFGYSIMTAGLIVATFVDFEIGEIPDEVSLGGLAAGLLISAAFPGLFDTVSRFESLTGSALGMLAGGGSIYALGVLGSIAFKKEAMGGGDVKLMAMIGSFLGWKLVLFTFFVAPVFGAIIGVASKIKSGNETIPYGPYLSLAAVLAIFFGNRILEFLFYGFV